MKNVLYLAVILLGIGFSSCEKDEDDAKITDTRDQYVGSWSYNEIGNLTLYQAGASVGTAPIDKSGSYDVLKSGTNGLLIGSKLFFVNGSSLSSDPESVNDTDNGFNMVGTETASGQLASNVITINSSITGTWSNSNGASGNFSGSAVSTLTK